MKNNGTINYFRDPSFPSVEVYKANKSKHIFPKHYHDDVYGICLMEKGASSCLGIDKYVKEGEIVLINPGELHSGVPMVKEGVSYSMLYINIDYLKKLFHDFCPSSIEYPEFKKKIICKRDTIISLSSFVNSFSNQLDNIDKQSLLFETILKIFFNSKTRDTSKKEKLSSNDFSMVKDFLASNLEKKITLDEMADIAGISKFHFLRLFKNSTGITPHIYRMQKRIEKSKNLLLDGASSLDIAMKLGFYDQSHFLNKFRDYIGATPTQFCS